MLATLASFVLAGVLGGRKLGRAVPTLGSVTASNGLIVGAVGVMVAGLFFEVLFRATRLSGLYSWDAWSFWVPKGKAIYFFGGLDEQFFTTLPGPSYPPLVPVLDAAAFHAMGSADVVTLHLQFFFLGLGFVWSVAGLFSERIPAWILWPFILVLLVAPRLGQRFAVPEADFLLDFFFALAAVLVAFWLLDEERWRLVVATTLLCGMVLTKREGLLLGAVLVAAALLASARRWRTAWPALGLAAVVALAVAVPWRIWYLIHGVGGERISEGLDPGLNTERLWPSVRLCPRRAHRQWLLERDRARRRRSVDRRGSGAGRRCLSCFSAR